jgi:hypothetical protein
MSDQIPSEPQPEGQLYRLLITATGVVRDADGNVLNEALTLEASSVLTEEQAAEIPADTLTVDERKAP